MALRDCIYALCFSWSVLGIPSSAIGIYFRAQNKDVGNKNGGGGSFKTRDENFPPSYQGNNSTGKLLGWHVLVEMISQVASIEFRRTLRASFLKSNIQPRDCEYDDIISFLPSVQFHLHVLQYQQHFLVSSVVIVAGLSIFPMVDSHFFSQPVCTHALTWECLYRSFSVNVVPTFIYNLE